MKRIWRKTVSTAVAVMMAASIITVPTWSAAAAYEPLLDLDFESGFAAEITQGSQEQNSGWNLEWPPDTDGVFHAKVEDSGLDDGSGKVLKMEQNASDGQTDKGNHQRISKTFDDWGTADQPTYDGIFDYSFKVYVPSNVPNGEDKIFNQGTYGDTSIELVDAGNTGQNEMVTFYVSPKANNKVSFKHVYGTESGEIGWETNGGTAPYFNMDEWLTIHAVIDTNKGTYRFSVESESLTMPMSQEFMLRSLGGTRGGIGRPEGIRIQCWRNANNLLTYYDDINFTPEVLFADVIDAQAQALTLDNTTSVVDDFSLPTTIGEYDAVVTWQSNDKDVIEISDNTAIVHPSDSQVLSATLTATVTLGNATATKEFPVTLGMIGADEAALNSVYSKLGFKDIKGENLMAKAVETDLQFISEMNGVSIAWASSDNAIVNPQTGAVVRDGIDHNITLTATLTIGSETPLQKEIPIRVIQYGTVIMADDFDWDTEYTTADATADTYAFGDTGWTTVGNTNNELNAENSTISLQSDVAKSGKAMELERRAKTDTGNHELIYEFLDQQDLTEGITLVEGSFKMTTNGRLTIRMKGSNGNATVEMNIDPRGNKDVFVPMHKANEESLVDRTVIGSAADAATGEWFDLRLELDGIHEKYDVFINNKKVNAEIVTYRFVNNTVSARSTKVRDIALFSARNDGNFATPYYIYVDDLIIRTVDIDYSVTSPAYVDANDANISGPVAGGTIQTIDVAKVAPDAESATLFVAVYDQSGNLAAIKSIEATEGTLTVGLDIPEIENPYMRTYVWENGFRPAATIFDSRAYTTTKLL